MTCPVCRIDAQRIRLDQHLTEEHSWSTYRAIAYYQQQIRRLLEEIK